MNDPDRTPDNILVVLQAEADNGALLAKAATLARGSAAPLRLFCCDHDPRLTARLMLSPDALSAARAAHLRRRRDWLVSLAAPLAAAGLEVDVEAAWDAPLAAGILTEVGLSRPGLVMKEAVWHAPLRRRLFGHSDWRLLQACPVPVLLTRPDSWSSPPRIAAALDPGHPGDPDGLLDRAILRQALRLAAWTGARLTAVHACAPLDPALLAAPAGGMSARLPTVTATALHAAAAAALDGLLSDAGSADLDRQLLDGTPLEALPAWCAAGQVDVLAVGVTSRSRVLEAIVGSTAEKLLEVIPSDLLTVRFAGA